VVVGRSFIRVFEAGGAGFFGGVRGLGFLGSGEVTSVRRPIVSSTAEMHQSQF
jgi:hypothetical protein